MSSKLLFLTKISLNKKIKTKWFLLANFIFAILIIGLLNIDVIIKSFGGDFDETVEIIVIDETNQFDTFKSTFEQNAKMIEEYTKTEVIKATESYDVLEKTLAENENRLLVVLNHHEDDFIQAKVVSYEQVGSITTTLINAALTSVRSDLVLKKNNISTEVYESINQSIVAEMVVLSEHDTDKNMIVASIMQIITLPLFMLIIFLVQMIGAEVNEEKTTKSMEIIISNVSPQTHFISKVISANLFVIIQGVLLVLFAIIGLILRFFVNKGSLIGGLDGEILNLTSAINTTSISSVLAYILPILVLMILLTFFAYSLLAGVLASMTTNLEDFQQLQTPIVVISLIGYYLSMMTSVFEGSLFIKIMSYVPFISSMLAPTLLVLGEITVIDLLISIILLVLVIYLLMKYGLRIYKVGILNYSGNNLWKKMFLAIGRK